MTNSNFEPWPAFSSQEIESTINVLKSGKVNYWTGSECRRFEEEFAIATNSSRAIALTNGTVALDLIWQALNIGAGDEVIVTSRTFIASVSSIVLAGAKPVFADVDRDSQNITKETIGAVITPRTKVILAVHLAGWPCDMDGLQSLADQHGLLIVEDCAQAHGAKYKGQPVGSFGVANAWSFCQDKIMTTGGEGGMVTTNDEKLWAHMWAYKDHGKSFEAVYNRNHSPGYRWLHESFGTNWRMLEIQAAIGRIQLEQLPEWTDRRQINAHRILATASLSIGLRVPQIPSDICHAFYKCYVFAEPERLKSTWDRDRIIQEMNNRDIPVSVGSCSEVYLEKAFDRTGLIPPNRLPVAKELGETSIMFMVHPNLSEENVTKTCETLEEVMELATN